MKSSRKRCVGQERNGPWCTLNHEILTVAEAYRVFIYSNPEANVACQIMRPRWRCTIVQEAPGLLRKCGPAGVSSWATSNIWLASFDP